MITNLASGASAYTCSDFTALHSLSDFGTFEPKRESKSKAWDPIIDELLRIRNLDDDWDGAGTDAPEETLVDGAISLAIRLRDGALPPDRVHVSVDSTIYFEWYSPLNYIEIEVISPHGAEARWLQKEANSTKTFLIDL